MIATYNLIIGERVSDMKKSWQVKVLLFFLAIFILSNLEAFVLKVIEFIVRIPLNFSASMTNVLGADIWSNLVVTTSNPIFLIITGLILTIFTIGIIRGIDSIKNR